MTTEPVSSLLGNSAEVRPLARQLLFVKRLQKRYRTLHPRTSPQRAGCAPSKVRPL
jgi:hypothetical protein